MSDGDGVRARASAQVDVFDVSDGYSADVSPASLAFGSGSGGSASVSASMSSGRSQVACSIANVSAPPGVTAEASGRTLSVSAAPGFSPGAVSFDVVEDGADPVSLRRSVYVASVERGAPGPPGADGRDADPETVARIEAAAAAAGETAASAMEAAQEAGGAAAEAKEKADAMSLLVRATPQGVVVGRDDGSGSFPDGSTRQSGDAFEVVAKGGGTVARFAKDALAMLGGRFSIEARPYDAGAYGTGVAAMIKSNIMAVLAEAGMTVGSSANSLMRFGMYGGFSIESSDTLGGGVKVVHDEMAPAFRIALTTGGKTTTLAVTGSGVQINGERVRREKVLYTAPSGANGFTQPTLSESAANFDVLEIYFHDNDGNSGSCRVCTPNGKRASLSTVWADNGAGGNMWIKSRVVSISGTSVKTYNNGTWNRTGDAQINGGAATNYYVANIVIDKIVGYR